MAGGRAEVLQPEDEVMGEAGDEPKEETEKEAAAEAPEAPAPGEVRASPYKLI